MRLRSLLSVPLLACFAAAPVAAAPAVPKARVEAVQAPAWLERGGERRPLLPGQSLGNRDKVFTGDGGRLLLQLPEGSAVKLGENAQMNLNALGRRDGGVYTAALDVLQGAFRFTTDIFRKTLQHRAINIRAATLTAGVRGTDLWGKSDAEKDLICLLEGRIVVTHPQGEAVELAQPLAFAAAPHGQAPAPVSQADPEQVQRWAEETEIQPGHGVLRQGGKWSVVLPPVATQAEALERYDQVRGAGFPARIRVKADGGGEEGYVYGLRVSGFADRAEAMAGSRRLAAELELDGALLQVAR
jgi:hypothetical protein